MPDTNTEIAVSVVVPMYNCAAYVEELLDSLAKQSFSDFEVICVNDGSTDNTLEIVNGFCSLHSNFSCISKENGGAGSARDAGMDVARGTYIMFLDADDVYAPTYIQAMYDAAESSNADVVLSAFIWEDATLGATTKDRGIYGVLAKQDGAMAPSDVPDLFSCTNPAPQNKMFRLEFLKKHELRFLRFSIAEDLLFVFSALPLASRIAVQRQNLVTIRTGYDSESITSGRAKNAPEVLHILRALYTWLDEHGLAEQYRDTFLKRAGMAFKYETNFAYNEDYLDEIVRMITTEEPWTYYTLKQVKHSLGLHSTSEQKAVDKLTHELDNNADDSEAQVQDLRRQLSAAQNRLAAARYLDNSLSHHAPIISIIIPIYNSESYVHELVRSISAQTFTHLEAIFIDDGSTDDTLPLLKEACALDTRLTCISVPHAGAGAARNTGIDAASGTYLMFFDADDEYDPNMLQEMYDAAVRTQADEVFCLYYLHDFETGIRQENIGVYLPTFPDGQIVKTREIKNMLSCISWRVTNVLFKKELVDQYHLRFSTTHISNDLFFISAYAATTETMVCIHKHLHTVRRRINAESLTSSRWKYTEIVLESFRELYAWLEEHHFTEYYLDSFLNVCFESISYNTGFPYNQKYIEAISKFLCCEKPWKDIDDKTLYDKYWKRFDVKRLKNEILKQQDLEDNSPVRAQTLSNIMQNTQSIELLAYEKYGRILNPNNIAATLAKRDKLLDEIKLQNKDLERRVKKSEEAQTKLKNSRSWRIGRAATWVPRKIKRLLK